MRGQSPKKSGEAASESSDQYAFGKTLLVLAKESLGSSAIPADLAAICAKASAKSPKDRYAGMSAVLDDLRRFLAHMPVAANPPSPVRGDDGRQRWLSHPCHAPSPSTVGRLGCVYDCAVETPMAFALANAYPPPR